MRALRTLLLLLTGAIVGFAAAAAALKRALPSRGGPESEEVGLVAVLDGVELRSRARGLRGGFLVAWLGGIALDLREAELAPTARLSLLALLGGIAIKVPPGWRVESRLHALGGGVAVDVPEPDDPEAPRLELDGFALLGGISVAARPGEPETAA